MLIFNFPEAIFWNSFYASLLAFSKRFLALTTSEDPN